MAIKKSELKDFYDAIDNKRVLALKGVFANNITSGGSFINGYFHKALIKALEKDDYADKLIAIYKEYPGEIDLHGPIERNLLMSAAYHGSKKVVEALVESGWNVNLMSKGNGDTAFIAAVCSGNLEIAKYLIEQGADPYAQRNVGRNALMEACKWKREDIAIWLSNTFSYDLDQVDKFGETALHHAAINGAMMTIIGKLVLKGANEQIKNNNGKTFIEVAGAKSANDIKRYLDSIKEEETLNACIDGSAEQSNGISF